MPRPSPTEPHYYAAIFTNTLVNSAGYEVTAQRMLELARLQPGFLGVESVRGADGRGITISYWASVEAIRGWGEHPEHKEARRRGAAEWYSSFSLRIARLEGEFGNPAAK